MTQTITSIASFAAKPPRQGNRIVGTFVGGSGRYKGATGTYEFSWRFLLENEDGVVQGQSMGLSGKVRFLSTPSEPGAGTSKP
ncbi:MULTISPECIES: hypothetical protein [Bradyrhizobium]|uniref:Uncharacterized protein n=1 Tax=Bradyrhizobium brasilense TaxID=1419277 RepID=A0ABY8JC44_9BRAD|nr:MULTISPECIES: hypothetical protein [Bradyrhizobium]WFU62025.1 hypothetical protein QA636_31675 [Bradyrhizobium brasilense]